MNAMATMTAMKIREKIFPFEILRAHRGHRASRRGLVIRDSVFCAAYYDG